MSWKTQINDREGGVGRRGGGRAPALPTMASGFSEFVYLGQRDGWPIDAQRGL